MAVIIASCTPRIDPAPTTPPQVVADNCGATRYQSLVGRSLLSVIDIDFHTETRFIGGNGNLPVKPASNRLNIVTAQDAPLPTHDNMITKVFCG